MNYIFSQHLILIIIQYTHSIVVEFVAKKVSGVMSEDYKGTLILGEGRWLDCLKFCQDLGQTNCQVVTMNSELGICRWIDHTNFNLTVDTKWELFNMGRLIICMKFNM